MARAELLRAYTEVNVGLKAAEQWEASYKDSPETFKRLVREEASLQVDLAEYLNGQAQRVASLINWTEVELKPLQASAVPPQSDPRFEKEMRALNAAIAAHIIELTTIGGQAGEYIFSRPIGINSLSDFILESAERHTAQLVKSVTDTTRSLLQRAIKRSINEGRDLAGTLDVLRSVIANPVRAEMIAATESVNAYQNGLGRFAEETGAVSKTWDALLGACLICAPMDGKTIPIGDSFLLPNGHEVLRPSGHPRCRCGMIYDYPK